MAEFGLLALVGFIGGLAGIWLATLRRRRQVNVTKKLR